MKTAFYILAVWTMTSGILAISMRNMVHCALALIAFFVGIAGIFFSLRAEFLGAVQIIVYVGAIAVLILFAIMLTRDITGSEDISPFSGGSVWGWLISLVVLCVLVYSLQDQVTSAIPDIPPGLAVENIGQGFMTRFAIPFEVISLLLTAALVGAVVIALEEPRGKN